jgi:hypothetical protein
MTDEARTVNELEATVCPADRTSSAMFVGMLLGTVPMTLRYEVFVMPTTVDVEGKNTAAAAPDRHLSSTVRLE